MISKLVKSKPFLLFQHEMFLSFYVSKNTTKTITYMLQIMFVMYFTFKKYITMYIIQNNHAMYCFVNYMYDLVMSRCTKNVM